MADDMTQEQMMELQKQNCVFCKIVRGEMQSLKVYEDETFLAVLDIRPAATGHVLLMPKEHVLFLPLLPESMMTPMFEIAAKLSVAIKDAMMAERMTIFIASGTAAEQPPPPLMHLIMHLIPRDKGDGLDALDIKTLDKDQSDSIALSTMFAQVTRQALMHKKRDDLLIVRSAGNVEKIGKNNSASTKETEKLHSESNGERGFRSRTNEPASRHMADSDRHMLSVKGAQETRNNPSPVPTDYSEMVDATLNNSSKQKGDTGSATEMVAEPTQKTMEFADNQAALASVLEMYPDLRRLIMAQPDLVSDYVKRSPQLARLFEGVNIRALGLMLARNEQLAQRPPQQHSQQSSRESQQQASDAVGVDGINGVPQDVVVRNAPREASGAGKPAIDMTDEELMRFVDGNQGLRQWLLNHPEELATRVGENKRLGEFFKGVDILAVSRKYREHFLRSSDHRGYVDSDQGDDQSSDQSNDQDNGTSGDASEGGNE